MPPDHRHRVGSLREWSPSWGLLSRRKNPHPDPIWVLQMFFAHQTLWDSPPGRQGAYSPGPPQ